MYCVRKVLEDLWWVGGNDRRLAMFEGVYAVPNGVSYNSYLLLDDKTVLFDMQWHNLSSLQHRWRSLRMPQNLSS